MKVNIILAYLCLAVAAFASCSNDAFNVQYQMKDITSYKLNTSDMAIRDPFVIVDHEEQCYYLIAPRWQNDRGSLVAYKSLNLKEWKEVGYVFEAEPDYLGTKDYWAPDVYLYKGNYYCFITLSGDNILRGTTILKGGTKPTDTYTPVLPKDQLNVTPIDMQSLDGSLYVDEQGTPWMIFCREWLQVGDGEIWAMKLKDDLSGAADKPFKLFAASEAPWTTSFTSGQWKEARVTDAPFIWKDEQSGNLIMTWSSGSTGGYSIGQSISKSGKLEGPWVHEPIPIYSSDGGHAMIFKDLHDQLKISFHVPNSGNTRVSIQDITIKDGKIERFDTSTYDPTAYLNAGPFEVTYCNIPSNGRPFSNMFDGNMYTCWLGLWWQSIGNSSFAPNKGIDPIFPPYTLVIDMKQDYVVESLHTLTRMEAGWTDASFLWDQKVKDYEYWISNDEFPANPTEADYVGEKGWTKYGASTFPVVNKDYQAIQPARELHGRYLKLIVTSIYFPGMDVCTNPNLGHIGFSEIRVKGYRHE